MVALGMTPRVGDKITQFAAIPLDHSFRPHPTVTPFCVDLRGDDPDVARDLFERWVKSTLKMPVTRRIFPVVHAWWDVRPRLEDWFGGGFSDLFGEIVRDVHSVSVFHGDRADCFAQDIVFVRPDRLSNVVSRLNLDPAGKHALAVARSAAGAYRELVRNPIPSA